MADTQPPTGPLVSLSPEERQAVDRVLSHIASNANAIEESLEFLKRLTESGILAALNGTLKDFDENFSAATRPELMGMVANLMMLLGLLSQISYQPFFDAAMKLPGAVNTAYPRFQSRQERLGVREAITILRSPEMAGLLQMMQAVLRAQRGSP